MAGDINNALAAALKQALVDAHHETVDHAHEKVHEHRTNYMEAMEGELADAFRRLGLVDFDDPDCSNAASQLLAACKEPTHQTDFIITLFALVGAALSGAFAAAAGYNQRLTNDGLRLHGELAGDPGTIAGLHARKFLSDGEAERYIAFTGAKDAMRTALLRAGYSHLTPDQAMVVARRFPSEEEALSSALDNAGMADEDQAWFKMLRWGPPGPAEALNMATQNIIDMPELQSLLEQSGISASWAQKLFDSSGATMPPEMAVRLFREGRMTVEQFEQVLLESNLKNKYVPFMKFLQFRPPPMEQALRMYRNGIATREETVKILEQNGFETYWAEKLTDAAPRSTTTSTKNLSPSTILDLYQVGTWSFEQTQAQLELLGYTSDEAYCLVFLEDRKMEWGRKQRAANRIGTRYTGWKIDRTIASSQLDQVGIPPQQRDDMLDEWDAVRETITAHLTRVDIKKAVKGDVISEQDGRNRLAAMGYSPADIEVIVKIDTWA